MCMYIMIQMCILPMYKGLEHRSPARFRVALGSSFAILFCLYASFATVAYLRFGPTVPPNLLNDLADGAWGAAAKVGTYYLLLTTYYLLLTTYYLLLTRPTARGAPPPRWA